LLVVALLICSGDGLLGLGTLRRRGVVEVEGGLRAARELLVLLPRDGEALFELKEASYRARRPVQLYLQLLDEEVAVVQEFVLHFVEEELVRLIELIAAVRQRVEEPKALALVPLH